MGNRRWYLGKAHMSGYFLSFIPLVFSEHNILGMLEGLSLPNLFSIHLWTCCPSICLISVWTSDPVCLYSVATNYRISLSVVLKSTLFYLVYLVLLSVPNSSIVGFITFSLTTIFMVLWSWIISLLCLVHAKLKDPRLRSLCFQGICLYKAPFPLSFHPPFSTLSLTPLS